MLKYLHIMGGRDVLDKIVQYLSDQVLQVDMSAAQKKKTAWENFLKKYYLVMYKSNFTKVSDEKQFTFVKFIF